MNMRSIAGLVLLAFVGGAAAFGWFTYDGALPWATPEQKSATPPATRALPAAQASALPAFIPTQPVVADSAHTEAMLLSLAARRMIENGKPLGSLLPRLQTAFGQTHPKALAIIAEAGENPLSNAALLDEFEGIAPELVRPAGTGWERIQYEFSTLFILRRGDQALSPSTARLARIKQNLIVGETPTALRLVRALPGAPNGADWIAKAQKAVAVMGALDTLDKAAISAITAPAPLAVPIAPLPSAMPETGQPNPAIAPNDGVGVQ